VTFGKDDIQLLPFDVTRDLARLAGWLAKPHVSPWWPDLDAQLQEARERPPGAGHVLIVVNQIPVGYMRWQKADVSALAELGLDGIPEGSVDMDVLIGEPAMVGQGIGRRSIQLLRDHLLEDSTIPLVGMVTAVANVAALRAIEAAGFSRFQEYVDPRYGACFVLASRR
jgi:aminoglycoside 6'-N-acetyltransferase